MFPAPEPPRDAPLFRPEALAGQESRWLGQVLVVPRLGQTLAAGLVAIVAFGILGLLVFGQHIRTERLAGALVPGEASARLGAHLYAPQETVGELRPGQRVLLRLDALPHQRHGHLEGVVRSVDPSDLSPAEAAAATGDPALAGAGPLFRVDVALAGEIPAVLLPTMTLEADVPVETRRLWRWVLGLDGTPAPPPTKAAAP